MVIVTTDTICCFQTKKGKSYLALRDLCVVLLSGQRLEVKCDMMSTAGAVFGAVVSFVNLVELAYFGLAYVKGKWLLGSPCNPDLRVPGHRSFKKKNGLRLGSVTLHV